MSGREVGQPQSGPASSLVVPVQAIARATSRNRRHDIKAVAYPHWYYVPAGLIFGVIFVIPTILSFFYFTEQVLAEDRASATTKADRDVAAEERLSVIYRTAGSDDEARDVDLGVHQAAQTHRDRGTIALEEACVADDDWGKAYAWTTRNSCLNTYAARRSCPLETLR